MIADKYIPNTQFVDKLPEICVNLSLISVYDMKCYSATELLYKLAEYVNTIIVNMEHNDKALEIQLDNLTIKLDYLLNEGMMEELKELIEEMYADGRLQALVEGAMVDINKRLTEAEKKIANNILVNVKDFGAIGDGVKDDTNAILQALQTLKDGIPESILSGNLKGLKSVLYFPSGTYVINSLIDLENYPIKIQGEGMYASVLKATASFAGLAVVRSGKTSSPTYTLYSAIEDIGFNLNATDNIIAFELYGVRDGSTYKNIAISGFGRQALRTGFSGTVMCQGLTLENIQAMSMKNIGSAGDTVSIFQLDGLYETTVKACKVLGISTSTYYAIGIHVGKDASSRGLIIEGCSVGNLVNQENSNVGILFNITDKCYANNNTIEKVSDTCIQFGDTSTSTNCSALNNRFYSPGTPIPLTFLYFKNANGCDGRIQSTTSIDSVVFGTQALKCRVEGTFSIGDFSNQTTLVMPTGNNQNIVFGTNMGSFFVYDENGLQYSMGGTTNIIQGGTSPAGSRLKITDASGDVLNVYQDKVLANRTTEYSTSFNAGNLLRLGGYRLWVSLDGKLRMKSGVPADDTDGIVVGTQSE